MSAQAIDLAGFLRSGQFSDMTLVCTTGEEFKVHKLVMCAMSPVISTAMKEPFEVSHASNGQENCPQTNNHTHNRPLNYHS
jgi:BTB/POZ domain